MPTDPLRRAAPRLLPPALALAFALLLLPRAAGFSFEVRPKPKKAPTAADNNPFVHTIEQRISDGTKELHVRAFAKLPDFKGKGSKIVGMTAFASSLYVTTSVSGAYIYKVDVPTRRVRLWFRLGDAVKKATGRVVNCENAAHGGLRGVAFPPDFATTGLFYTSYVEDRPWVKLGTYPYMTWPRRGSRSPDSVVVEWRYDFKTKKVDPTSYRNVIRIPVPVYDHPIKQIVFQGPNLLITHGDASVQSALGGGGMRNDGLGKVLRIDPRLQKSGRPYGIPRSNPFVGWKRYRDEIFALGFRNPHTICVARYSNMIFVTDAGRDNAEEVNLLVKGANYGWPEREGTFRHLRGGGTGTGIGALPAWDAVYKYRYPVAQIGHFARSGSVFQGQAIAGGCPIENGSDLSGTYWFANFPSNGQMYYCWVADMKRATVLGGPRKLKTARVFRAKIVFYRRGYKTVRVNNFRELLWYDGYGGEMRADVRFGRGPNGEMYISSKTSGKIYEVMSSHQRVKKRRKARR